MTRAITAWMPETDQHRLAVLGKLAEEASELAGRCARSIIQGLGGIDPTTGRTNHTEIEREIADVIACIQQFEDREGMAVDPERISGKCAGFNEWHELIDSTNAKAGAAA